MAQAFFEKYSPENEVQSAGYSPGYWVGRTLEMTQFVKICMDEEGIDVRSKISKALTEEMVNWADKIIVFDSLREDWPNFLRRSEKIEVWEIADPRGGDLEVHRRIRDEIKERVKRISPHI